MKFYNRSSLHGNVPNNSKTVLIVIDMFNDFDFKGGWQLQKKAMRVARNIAVLKRKLARAKIPTVYVNDNFGKWQSDRTQVLLHFLRESERGKKIAQVLELADQDYFVLKAKHSIFYETGLDLLMKYLGVENIILTGITADHCLFFSAAEAHMRDLNIFVPRDSTASIRSSDYHHALRRMENVFDADTRPSAKLKKSAFTRKRKV